MNLQAKINKSSKKEANGRRTLANPEDHLKNISKISSRCVPFQNNMIVIDTSTLPDGLATGAFIDEIETAVSFEEIKEQCDELNIHVWLCHSSVKISYGSFYYDSENDSLLLIRTTADKFIITAAELNDSLYDERKID